MSILYLTDPYPDFLADQIYRGLCTILGPKSIVDYPSKGIYHNSSQKVWYLPQVPENSHSEEDIISLLEGRCFNFACLSSPREGSIRTLKRLASKAELPPVVIIDGEDDSRIRYEIAETFGARLYFKREYIWKNGKKVRQLKDYYNYIRSFHYNKNLFRITYPLPFSAIIEAIPQATGIKKEIGVSFRAFVWSKTSRKRIQAYQILRQAKSVNFSGAIYTPRDMAGRLSPSEYYREIQKANIAISIRGGGFDTQRFWEILACKTLLISEDPDIVIPDTFEHKKHAVFCRSDLSNLADLVQYYLENDQERETIAKQGYQHLLNYHTCEKRANYFLDLCLKEL